MLCRLLISGKDRDLPVTLNSIQVDSPLKAKVVAGTLIEH